MTSALISLRYEGEGLFQAKFPRLADRHFVIGQDYLMTEHQLRSMRSHAHEFAWLTEAWKNLPEGLADLYPSPEHLRKRALIDAGFYHQSQVDAGSRATALRFASFIQADDEFAVAVVREHLAIKRVAESQAVNSMGPKRFQESKQALIETVSSLIGVSSSALTEAHAA